MRLPLLAFFLSMVFGLGQVAYPYPQPKPTNGVSPITVIGLSTAIGPSHYDNENPAVWDTDIGGGLQSRLNSTDRMNTKWMRLGGIVMDQEDRRYYGIDYLPGTTNLAPWRPLFSLEGNFNDTSIYNNNGVLLDFRTVTLNNNSLTFQGVGQFTVNTTGAMIDSGPLQLYGNDAQIMGRTSLKIRTPGVLNQQVTNNWVLTLMDQSTGLTEWRPPQGGSGGGAGDGSIYLNDGGILVDRKLSMNQHNLAFMGGGGGTFFITNNALSHIGGTAVKLAPLSSLQISTPTTRSNLANIGDVLRVTSVTPGDYVTVDLSPPAFHPTFYATNGTIPENRHVTIPGYELLFDGANPFRIIGPSTVINASNSLSILTPGVNSSNAPVGSVLTLMDGGGTVEFKTLPTNTNIYNTSSTLTSDRVVSGGNKKLTFSGVSELLTSAVSNTVSGTTLLGLKTPGLASANPGNVLKLVDKTSGSVEFGPSDSFYTTNGALTSDRSVDGVGRFLKFTNNSTLDLKGQNTTLSGTSQLNLITPGVNAQSSTNGQILSLVDVSSGKVEFISPPLPVTDTSIYITNGTLAGDRIVEGNFRDLSFTNINVLSVRTRTNTLSGQLEFNIRTPAVVSGLAVAGQVLTLQTNSGRVEYQTPVNIYTANGALTSNRQLTMGDQYMSFVGTGPNSYWDTYGIGAWGARITNVNHWFVNSYTMSTLTNDTAASTEYRLRTPRIFNALMATQTPFNYGPYSNIVASPGDPRIGANPQAGAAAPNMVLTLLDGTTGKADYYPVTNIYSFDSALASNRTVDGAGKFLSFTNLTVGSLSASNTIIRGVAINLVTTNITAGLAVSNQVFTLQDVTTGRGEWKNSAGGGGPTIYSGDAALAGNRLVSQVGNTLKFDGPGSFVVANNMNGTSIGGTNITVYAPGALQLLGGTALLQGATWVKVQTPKVFATTVHAGDILTSSGTDGTAEWQTPLVTTNSDTSIYNNDGLVSANRKLDGGGKTLNFTNLLDFTAVGVTVGLSGSGGLRLKTPSYASKQGQFLQLTDQTTGAVEFNTTPDVSIYNANGSIPASTTRTVTIPNGSSLQLTGQGSLDLGSASTPGHSGINSGPAGYTAVGGTTTFLGALGTLYLDTPKVYQATSLLPGMYLQLVNTNGLVDFSPFPMDISIYSTNGTLLGNRVVSMNGNSLAFQGAGDFSVNNASSIALGSTGTAGLTASGVTTVSGTGGLILRTKNANASTAATGQVLTYQADGTAEYAAAPSVNLYNTSAAITANRDVGLASRTLQFNGPGTVNFNTAGGNFAVNSATAATLDGATTTIKASTAFKLQTPKTFSGSPPNLGDVLTYNANGTSEFSVPANLYTIDGNLTADRNVHGVQHGLYITGVGGMILSANYNWIYGLNELRLSTPLASVTNVTPGWVLTAQNSIGTVEYAPIPTVTTLYTGNGTLTSTRAVNLGGNSLTFQGGTAFQATNVSNLTLQSSGTSILEAGATGSLRIRTPKVTKADTNAPAVVGSVLTLQNLNGDAEYAAIPPQRTFYYYDGSLSSHRTVDGAGFSLTYANMGFYQTVANTWTATASGAMYLQTPAFRAAANGWVLTLMDSTSGRVEFQAPPTSGSGTTQNTIYNHDDHLATDRTVDGVGGVTGLTFSGLKHFAVTANRFTQTVNGDATTTVTGNSTVTSTGTTTVTGAGRTTLGTTSRTLGNLHINTPLVQNSTDAASRNGYVLTLSSDGSAEYKLAASSSEYHGDGVLYVTTGSQVGVRIDNMVPTFTGTDIPNYTRLSFKSFDFTTGGALDTLLQFGTLTRPFFATSPGVKFSTGYISAGTLVEAMYDSTAGAWIMLNVGKPPALLANSPPSATVDAMVSAGAAPESAKHMVFLTPKLPTFTTVTLVGVVDTAPELAAAPLEFKKISTLGALTVGDGKHADYYLTAYDPTVGPGYAIRSTVDTGKMWKQLIAH